MSFTLNINRFFFKGPDNFGILSERIKIF